MTHQERSQTLSARRGADAADAAAALFATGVVVPDLEAAMAELSSGAGVEWSAIEERGDDEPSRAAVSRTGTHSLELIEPLGDGPWRPHPVPGIDHMSYVCDDRVATRDRLVRDRWTVEHEGSTQGHAWSYLHGEGSGLRIKLVDIAAHAEFVERFQAPSAGDSSGPRVGQLATLVTDVHRAAAEAADLGLATSKPTEITAGGWTHFTVLTAGVPQLELISAPPGAPMHTSDGARFDHLCLWFTDWEAAVARLEAAGVPKFWDDPSTGVQFSYHRAPHSGLVIETMAADFGPTITSYFDFSDDQ